MSTEDHLSDADADAAALEEAVWRLATALACSVTPADVAEALAGQAAGVAGGTFANMAVLHAPSGLVRVVHHQHEHPAEPVMWQGFDLDDPVPACDAMRSGLPVLLGSRDEIARRYPQILGEIEEAGLEARASLALHGVTGGALGALGIGWAQPQAFGPRQLRRLDLIAQLSGPALERAVIRESRAAGERAPRSLESMPDAFVALNPDLRVAYVNPQAERVLRTTRAELEGRLLFDAFPDAQGSAFERELLRAVRSGRPVEFEEYYPPFDGWYEVRAWPDGNGLNVAFSNIDERRRLELARTETLRESERSNARLRFVSELTGALAGAATAGDIWARLSRAVIPVMADWCTVVVPRGEELVRVAAAHRQPALDGLVKRLVGTYPHSLSGPSPGVTAYRSKEPLHLGRLVGDIVVRLDDSSASAAYGRTLLLLGDGPGLVMPILDGDEVVGVLTMVRSAGAGFDDADVATMGEAAARVVAALADADHVAAQHETASVLQAASLPTTLPAVDGIELAAGYRGASRGSQVGGDWYDALQVNSGRVALVVGDVAGHGLRAAAQMAQMRNALRAHLFAGSDPLSSLGRLSELVAVQEPEAFATAICVELDPATGALAWASAGHPPPLLVHPDGTSVQLPGRPAPPIGWPYGSPPDDALLHRHCLAPGDRLILFTDGLVERRGVDLQIGLTHLMFAAEQTRRGAAGAAEACDALLSEMLAESHEDDVCVLIADRLPGG